jgi:bacterioferritin-associated ferredoxin
MQPDDLLCYCFHISHRKVMNYARIHQPSVPSQLSECGGAGTGCGWCVPFLKKHFEAFNNAGSADIEISAEDYAAQRQSYLADKKKGQSEIN